MAKFQAKNIEIANDILEPFCQYIKTTYNLFFIDDFITKAMFLDLFLSANSLTFSVPYNKS